MTAKLLLLISFILFSNFGSSQGGLPELKEEKIQINTDEKWWGGAINDGVIMPFAVGYSYDMYGNLKGNQSQPLLLSNQGRIIWSESPFKFTFSDTEIIIQGIDQIHITEGKENLKNAFKFASKNYFPPNGKMPDRLLFEQPQYNTWIELIYNQNQKDILKYAHSIIDNGFPPGVLMIDDNWQEAYGNWKFHPERFPSPKTMINELHELGFKVMLWVCPFVSPDTEVFRSAAKKGIFLKYPDNQAVAGFPESYFENVAMIGWWNGYSALLDFSNPEAKKWFKEELQYLVDEYKVDGFKLDAGDAVFYPSWLNSHERNIFPNTHSELFAQIGLDFPLNEYRATWKMAGKPLAQRLRDKGHNWKDLQTLIPNITVQGLMGYAFTCPDMIGGGEFNSFINTTTIDQELIVRSAQVHALMPMMQFSVAPWRILDKEHLSAVKTAIALRQKFTSTILDLAEEAAKNGQPIVRTMEYVYPNAQYENIKDQFFLGDDLLVAPVLKKNQTNRIVVLPKGKWQGFDGKIYSGNKEITVKVKLNTIPYFQKIK
ncbi:glycoside hydrolase [Arenibacter sp. TNZ]|uniref:glycoside hydrolase family 31 protein n=1 Tax=Arenibacter TaxID=178469 RepID=UPI000CD43727|nr:MULTISPECIES: glycoside hydrolase family 31 protein [Arenibacter]MCM4172778.1 glycoside hydrolase [Arenibacter sp. TNZ]